MIIPTMNVSPDQRVSSGFTVSKLPIYVLNVLQWIPDVSKSRAYTRLKIITMIVFHVLGLSSELCFHYGLIEMYQDVNTPTVLKYTLTVPSLYLTLNAYLFIFTSWTKRKNQELLHKFINDSNIHYKWTFNNKFYILCMTCHALAGIFAAWFVTEFLIRHDSMIIYHFIKSEAIKTSVGYSVSIYVCYLASIYYFFPIYIAYNCICFTISMNELNEDLHEYSQENPINTINIFNTFVKGFNELLNIINNFDGICSKNIALFMVMSVSNAACWLHLAIVFNDCKMTGTIVVVFFCESISLMLLMITAAILHSNVSVYF